MTIWYPVLPYFLCRYYSKELPVVETPLDTDFLDHYVSNNTSDFNLLPSNQGAFAIQLYESPPLGTRENEEGTL